MSLLLMVLGNPFILGICLERIIKKTDFYEWDYTERQKKKRFLIAYTLICSALSNALMLFLGFFIAFYMMEAPVGIIILSASLIIFFVFNILNIPSLFHPVFEKDLKQAYKIQKKPNNWTDNGEEISDEDMYEEIMRRDFGI